MPLNLVVQTAFLGDLLLSIPLLKQCKAQWPNHQLALVCRNGLGEFFLKTGIVDHVFEIKKGDSASYQKALSEIQKHQVDFLISPHQSLRTAFFCRKIKAKKKISFKNFWSGFFFNESVHRDIEFPDAIRQISLLQNENPQLKQHLENFKKSEEPFKKSAHGHLSAPPAWASMSLRQQVMNKDLFNALVEKFKLQEFEKAKSVLIFPGSVWATKRWTEEGFIKAGVALKEAGYHVLVMGGPGEEELSERVAVGIGAQSLAGKTKIFESAQLIAHASLVLGNDSASTHLAAVCETPLIAVFGPTILEFGYRPWSAQSYIVEKTLSCRPCGKHGHKVCPIGTHECMKGIPAEDVLSTAGFILQS
jgi:heptosyltransferase-2